MSRDEKITAFALGLTVCLWIGGQSLGINAVAAALAGLSILLVTSECSAGPGRRLRVGQINLRSKSDRRAAVV